MFCLKIKKLKIKREGNYIPILQPRNTIQVAQTGIEIMRRTRIVSRTICSKAALVWICCCCCIDIHILWKQVVKYTPRFTCFNVNHLQFLLIS